MRMGALAVVALVAGSCGQKREPAPDPQPAASAPEPAAPHRDDADARPSILAACTDLPERPVAISADFSSHDAARYSLVREIRTTRNGRVNHGRAASEVAIECLPHEGGGMIVRWNQRLTEAPPQASDAASLAGRLTALWSEFEVDIVVSDRLRAERVENIEEVIGKLEAVITEFERELRVAMPPDEADRIVRSVRDMLTPDLLTASLCADLMRLLVPAGVVVDPSESLTWQEPFTLPIGGEPFPVTMHLHIAGIDPGTGRIGLRQEREIDAEAFCSALMGSLMRMAHSLGKPPPTDEDLPVFEHAFLAEYLMDPASPWPKRAVLLQSSASGSEGRSESWAWERIDD